MTERGFDTGFWGDGFIRKIEPHAKLLYVYLWTNEHCNPAGLYEITLDVISFETGIPETELPNLLEKLKLKVGWFPEESLIWVKNFIKRQSKSSKFLAAAAKTLTTINSPNVINELLTYNLARYSISIPYQYYIDSVSILTRGLFCSGSVSSSGTDKGVTEKEGPGEKTLEGSGAVPRTNDSAKSADLLREEVPSSSVGVPSPTSDSVAVLVTLYENHFGIMTPNIAEEIKDICRDCPAEWIPLAFKEYSLSQGHSFKYLIRIIENWKEKGAPSLTVKGVNHGVDQRNSKEATAGGLRATGDTTSELKRSWLGRE
jgi:DnaD/phage-associated family protein